MFLNVYFLTFFFFYPDNLFQYSNAHPHGYSEKSLSLKRGWGEGVGGEKRKRQVLRPNGSAPRVERVATERQAVGGEETGLGGGEVY